jgi:hypothetical protein
MSAVANIASLLNNSAIRNPQSEILSPAFLSGLCVRITGEDACFTLRPEVFSGDCCEPLLRLPDHFFILRDHGRYVL